GRLRALEIADLLLERANSWIGVTGVNVALFLSESYGMPYVDVSISERDAVHDRHLRGTLVSLAVLLARPDRDGAFPGAFALVSSHDDLPALSLLRTMTSARRSILAKPGTARSPKSAVARHRLRPAAPASKPC